MAGSVSDNYGAGRSVDSLTEWRSSEQLETGTPSTSPPYWDTDDDDDGGLRPSQLYGKFTWKIENFSQITKRELRSNVFEVGGYKWYILIYPQGCDVCNHLSLFLCVANHDKLLPGWSHFAQFTIAVVNRDAKKSKYSDTLHRFWKKEHDWGWKKFMELSKVLDGFIDKDSLVIKAQVQVIREKTDRPFRCLDCQYRRELIRVYLSNVEQICRRFVEERRSKLAKLIEDKVRWSSFHAFWLGMDQNTRRLMSRDKTDVILKVVVKHFFIEKEVTSTLVMDSLYSGLKALENQSKNKNVRLKMVESEEIPAPIVYVEKDTFVLADDILLLLERAALEPLPPKDDKGPQNRTKDGSSGDDVNKDLIERDERRLTELGRRTVEIFILAHIFSNRIEVAYQEAIALKRQEELIREEEAAGQAESELKAKRSEKEKRGKKKQAKQRKSNRKGKDKGRDEKLNREVQDTHQIMTPSGERILENCSVKQTLAALEKKEVLDEASDITDAGDELNEVVVPNFEEGESCALNSDTDTSEIHPGNEVGSNEIQGESTDLTNKNSSIPDDSSSTCSTDSVPSVSTNGSYNGVFSPNHKTHFSSRRGKSQHFKVISKGSNSAVNLNNQPTHTDTGGSHQTDSTTNCISSDPGSGNTAPLVNDREQLLVQRVVEKLEEAVSLHTEINPTETEENSHFKQNIRTGSSPPWSPKGTPCQNKQQIHSDLVSPSEPSLNWETPSNGLEKTPRTTVPMTKSPLIPVISNSDTPKPATSSKNVQSLPVDKSITRQLPTMSRPLSAPLVPGPRPISSAVSTSSSEPSLARSVSAAGRLGIETSSSNHGYLPQSYRNAIIGKTTGLSSNSVPLPMSSSSLSPLYNQSSNPLSSTSSFSLKTRTMDVNSTTSGYTFGLGGPDLHHSGRQWFDRSQPERRNVVSSHFDIHNSGNFRPESYNGGGLSATCKMPSGFQEDFPHLDIINDLLNEEKCSGSTSEAIFDGSRDSLYHINRQYSFPGNVHMDMDLSTNPCSLDRVYSLPFDGFRDGVSANMPSIYANGEIDGIILNQWQGSGFDGSLFNIKTMEENRYQNPLTNYLNVPCGANGFPIFRPSNGN